MNFHILILVAFAFLWLCSGYLLARIPRRVRREQWQVWKRKIRLAVAVVFWALKIVPSLLFALLCVILSPVLPFFADRDGWLPWWLWWFQTPDNPIDGEPFWRERHPRRHTRRMLWLVRNAGYGFDWRVLSPRIPDKPDFQTWGNPDVGNRPLVNGVVFRCIQGSNPFNTIWQFYYVRAWSRTRCIRINLGYKIWDNPQPGKVAQIVFSPSPCMGCELSKHG